MDPDSDSEENYAEIVRRGVADSSISEANRDIVANAILARVIINTGDSSRAVDPSELRSSVEETARQIQAEIDRLRGLGIAGAAGPNMGRLLDGICERIHLPWPICCADD
jgi:hypothetical protein